MKISHRWINETMGLNLSVSEMEHKLTLLGLEVGSIDSLVEDFTDVFVAEVMEAKQHPNADRLRVCQVFDGRENFEVVCGAPNARKGIKVAFAKIGAVLPGNFKIKKSKIRDVVSHGMLCSSKELGLGEEHDGIIELLTDAPVGENIRQYLALDDSIFDLELTPNRGDCFSLKGVVRELSAQLKLPMVDFASQEQLVKSNKKMTVYLEVPEACPRFVGQVIENTNCQTATPNWMLQILQSANIRSINLVVDITHFVMLKLGQPMHAYDLQKIEGDIAVRYAHEQEQLTLLDGTQPKLTKDFLLITSRNEQKNKALGLAGIMGGKGTGVDVGTTTVFFEAAHFTPDYMIGKARKLHMQTDASVRFERGVDPSISPQAIRLATDLLISIAGGQAGELVDTQASNFLNYCEQITPQIDLSLGKANKKLGVELSTDEVSKIFNLLHIENSIINEEKIRIKSPIHRFDLLIEEDYIEEIARLYGYEKLAEIALQVNRQTNQTLNNVQTQFNNRKHSIKDYLSHLGFNECISYSFIDENLQKKFFPNSLQIPLANPIASDMGVMRLSLLPSLIKNGVYNYNHQRTRSLLFEEGYCFQPKSSNVNGVEDIEQAGKLAFIVVNYLYDRHWLQKNKRVVDYYLVKGFFESLLGQFNMPLENIKLSRENLPQFVHPGQSANILLKTDDGERKIGILGMLHPMVQQHYDVPVKVGICEIDNSIFDAVIGRNIYKKHSIYPIVSRDLSLWIDHKIAYEELTTVISSWKIKNLVGLNIFDIYQDENKKTDNKSIALNFEFQSTNKTLEDKEIKKQMETIVQKLCEKFSAEVRD